MSQTAVDPKKGPIKWYSKNKSNYMKKMKKEQLKRCRKGVREGRG